MSLRPGETERATWALARTHGWYDLTASVAGDAAFAYRCAGHVENGKDSISDPALGGLV
ncbi:phospholipase domain-containing protein [Micromonospora sp. NPDC051227]|uniref:phospholipase domain-containing protein n=1 Tax=Micromonospora sp. NPDC051227 TaxID=3364285 RepID=UPI00378AFA79